MGLKLKKKNVLFFLNSDLTGCPIFPFVDLISLAWNKKLKNKMGPYNVILLGDTLKYVTLPQGIQN